MKKQHLLATFLLTSVATACWLAPSSAKANWRRKTAVNSCTTFGVVASFGGTYFNAGKNNVHVKCALDDDSYFAKGTINGINIHGRDAITNGGVFAKVCVADYGSGYVSCGPTAATSYDGVGEYMLQPDISLLNAQNAAHFAYLVVTLQGGTHTTYHNSVNGYFIH